MSENALKMQKEMPQRNRRGAARAPRIVVIGLGNAYRGDDAVGPLLARRLAARCLPGIDVAVVHSSVDVLAAWQGADAAVILDAMDLGAKGAGQIRRFEYPDDFFSEDIFPASTHALGLASVVQLAHRLSQLPPRLVVYGIAGRSFTIGTSLSPAVRRNVKTAADRVLKELASLRREFAAEGESADDA